MGNRHTGLLWTAFALVCLSAPYAAQASPVLGFSPSATTVGFNRSFDVQVVVGNVATLAIAGFEVTFDPALIELAPVPATLGGFLASTPPDVTDFVAVTDGSVPGWLLVSIAQPFGSSGASTAAPATLAVLHFISRSTAGTTPLSFQNVIFYDAANADLFVTDPDSAVPLPAEAATGSVTVRDDNEPHPTPEPPTILALAAGLAAAVARARRRKPGQSA